MIYYEQRDIMNRVSRTIIVMLLAIIVGAIVAKKLQTDAMTYNFVDLQMRYKHYIVVDKEEIDKDTYILRLRNPETNQTNKVYVKPYLYQNVYFVGDTIK